MELTPIVKMQLFDSIGDLMNIEKYPQFQLYLLTLNLLMLKNKLIPENCDERCVNATIINRAYYSSYLYCELWLDYVKNFKTISPWDFEDGQDAIGEHKQVRDALYNFGEPNMKTELQDLAILRRKADYDPFLDIEPKEVENAIHHMEKIFNHLKFE